MQVGSLPVACSKIKADAGRIVDRCGEAKIALRCRATCTRVAKNGMRGEGKEGENQSCSSVMPMHERRKKTAKQSRYVREPESAVLKSWERVMRGGGGNRVRCVSGRSEVSDSCLERNGLLEAG